MGIDVYLRWPNQTEQEVKAQYTGFSVTAGDRGYLREAYHGEPYATRVLVPEGWEGDSGEVQIKAATLRERLPEVLRVAQERDCKIYNNGVPLDGEAVTLKAFRDFVDLAERMEAKHGSISVRVSA